VTGPHFDHVEVYRDTTGDHRWRFVSSNGRTLADSAEGYHNRGDALTALATVTGGRVAVLPGGEAYLERWPAPPAGRPSWQHPDVTYRLRITEAAPEIEPEQGPA
jgi:uncharacterized protein YegP (UPF0339 family)